MTNEHITKIKSIREELFPASYGAYTAEQTRAALDVYEFSLKAEGVSEIEETLGQLAPLLTVFIEGLTEAASAKKP
jgi:hypothetical protein